MSLARALARASGRSRPHLPITHRIVILGGSFAGVTTAQHLEHAFGPTPVSMTLVSKTNALLFTPMLAEVAASSLEPTHISSPLRIGLRRTRVIRARASRIDLDRRCVGLGAADGGELAFDHLVLAVGSVSNYLGLDGVERTALDFKTLGDAIRIRSRVIEMFERADRETDPKRRRTLLTFVVAGGGFAGARLAAGLKRLRPRHPGRLPSRSTARPAGDPVHSAGTHPARARCRG